MEKQRVGVRLDIVFVIDATSGMSGFVNQIKGKARDLANVFARALDKDTMYLSQLRVKVIDFADYATEAEDAIHQTRFFNLPTESDEFARTVNGIRCEGRGGDLPDNGLEALYLAMKSKWTPIRRADKGKYVTRHVIVLLADTVPLDFGERDGCVGYEASEFPSTFEQMQEEWAAFERDVVFSISPLFKRMFLFAPEGEDSFGHTWKQVAELEKTKHFPVKLRNGLKDISFNEVLSVLIKNL